MWIEDNQMSRRPVQILELFLSSAVFSFPPYSSGTEQLASGQEAAPQVFEHKMEESTGK